MAVPLRHFVWGLEQLSGFLSTPLPESFEYIHFAAPGWRKSLLCQHHWRRVFFTKPTFCLRGSPLSEALGKDFANCQKWQSGRVPNANCLGVRGAFTPTIPPLSAPSLPRAPGRARRFSNVRQQKLFQLLFKGFLFLFSSTLFTYYNEAYFITKGICTHCLLKIW